MTINNYIIVLLVMLFITSCKKQQPKNITNAADYSAYLENTTNSSLDKAEENFQFWNTKLEKTPNQYVYLTKIAGAHASKFEATANIKELKLAEENLVKINAKTNYKNSSYLRNLAHNYISQHRFKEALSLVKKAENNGDNLKASQKMLFDVHLELGNDDEAKAYLEKIKNFSDFDYLIRLAKWSDHNSDLDSAINYMEKATAIAESSNIKSSKIWSYTNLADFYGHSGQVEKAYQYYLKSLELDPSNAYAKKGIAWIVFSYENNSEEANRIISKITETNNAPDYFLLKAEIAAFNKDKVAENKALENYFKAVSDSLYGDMYNVYSAKLYVDSNPEKALELARIEVANRPTAMSYSLLAWSTFKSGKKEDALAIIEKHVLPFTTEPDALFHAAKILSANGKTEKANELKAELLDSSFEIGPATLMEVKNI